MDDRKRLWLGAGILAAVGLFIYWPALHGGWIWDDEFELTGNRLIRDPQGWWRIWWRPVSSDYFPLKSEVQWLGWRIWGARPEGYHLLSLGFAVLGAFLLWRLLARWMGEGTAFFGGLFFLVHPVAVESVAWISELKNVMSFALLMAAFLGYLDWEGGARTPGVVEGDVWRSPAGTGPSPYLRSVGWFLLAMLCKSSVVMFPVVLLLYAWWRRGRIARRDVAASLPFFGISLLLGLVTLWFQSHWAIADTPLRLGGWAWRVGSAGMAVVFYFFKSVWPAGVMPIYPDWGAAPRWEGPLASWAAIVAVLGWLWSRRAGFGRTALFGLGFFLLNLVPVLGFVPMSYERISRVADHLGYLPLAGIAGLVAAAIALARKAGGCGQAQTHSPAGAPPPPYLGGGVGRTWMSPPLLSVAALFVVLVLAGAARREAAIFGDPAVFWSQTLWRNPAAWLADNNLGTLLSAQGRYPEAAAHFERVLRERPDEVFAENNLGDALLNMGRTQEALGHFERAVRMVPNYADAYYNWGRGLLVAGRYGEAIDRFDRSLRFVPERAEAYNNRGLAWASLGRVDEAATDYRHALRLAPNLWEAHLNLGLIMLRTKRPAEAIPEFEAVLRLRPRADDARNYLADARKRLKSP